MCGVVDFRPEDFLGSKMVSGPSSQKERLAVHNLDEVALESPRVVHTISCVNFLFNA